MSHLWIRREENGQEERKQTERDQEDQSISYATSRRLYLLPSSLQMWKWTEVKWSDSYLVLLLMEDITETKVSRRKVESEERERERRHVCEHVWWSRSVLIGQWMGCLVSLKICFHWIYFFFFFGVLLCFSHALFPSVNLICYSYLYFFFHKCNALF